jgi:predicted  nucleic acid-binding Zn-ribbon protein
VEIAFDKLIRLQYVDIEINAVSSLLEAIPARLESFESDARAAAEVVMRAKDKLAANQKKRRDLEGEVKAVKEQASKFKRQLNDVKTNKEYTALLKEIEETQRKTETLEEEILNEMIGADDIEKEIKAANAKKSADEARIQSEKQAVMAEKAGHESRRAALESEREAILPEIPPEQLKLYERIARRMRGVALSPIKDDDFCSLCQMRVRPQMLNELQEMKQVILCEACGRILYLPHPPAATAPGPVETISPEPAPEAGFTPADDSSAK